MRYYVVAAAAVALSSGLAVAQGQKAVDVGNIKLVDVTVTGGVLNNILQNADIDVDVQVPANVTVQVPIGVAANVCDTTVAVLTADLEDDGQATCNATSSNGALANSVIREVQS